MSRGRKIRIALIVTSLVFSSLIGAGTQLVYKSTQGDPDSILREIGSRYRNHRTEKLTLCLDGVSWEVMRDLKREGHFKMFQEPSRVIVPFPSMTNVCLTDVWQKPPLAGYESLYFDRAANRVDGGSMTYLKRRSSIADSYESLIDYMEPKPFEFLIYVLPRRIPRSDLTRWLDKYYSFDKRHMRAYLKSIDGITHIRGRQAQETLLLQLDQILAKLVEEKDGGMEIALFSDHGNNFVPSRRVDVGRYLKNLGFRVENKITDGRSVVIPVFGLVGFSAFYTQEKNKPGLAVLLSGMEGVDFAMYRAGDGVHIVASRGSALLQADPQQTSYRYSSLDGDPLELQPVQESLRQSGKMDPSGFAKDRDWFEALAHHRYPDALRRLYRGVYHQVQNNADVLINFKDGYYYGSWFFDQLATIEATHGSLFDTCSIAFFMSTRGGAPATLRSEELLHYFP